MYIFKDLHFHVHFIKLKILCTKSSVYRVDIFSFYGCITTQICLNYNTTNISHVYFMFILGTHTLTRFRNVNFKGNKT